MAGKGNKEGFFTKVKSEFSEGTEKVFISFKKGYDGIAPNTVLLLKYTVLTLIVAFLYAGALVLFPDFSAFSYSVFLPISILIILFYHELLNVQVRDFYRVIYDSLVLAFFFLVVYFLFSYSAAGQSAGSGPGVVAIAASTVAMFIFVVMLFSPVYMVKAGATPLNALKNAFRFISRNAIKGMFYIIVLLLVLSSVTALLSAIGLVFVSPIAFVFLSYCMFIFVNAFWDCCRND
ncbi:MAG: hypothetical protein QXS93_03815 [Candidatus Micrarchaeia archaeon]